MVFPKFTTTIINTKMKGKAQRVRLGIFILFSSVLLLVIIGFFTARRLFEQKDYYYVAYQGISVSGLETGSPVKYLGINVGSISNIRIDPKSVSTIIVEISLTRDTPVKVDAIADIVALGITGLKTIEISGGSQEADFLEPGEFIKPGTSMVAEITGRAEVIAYKVEEVLNNLQEFTMPENIGKFAETAEKLSLLAENTSMAMSTLDAVVTENRQDIREASASINNLSGRLEMTSEDLHSGISRFNELMQGDDIGELLGNLRDISLSVREADVKELIESVALATMQTQKLLLRLDEDFASSSEQVNDNLLLLQYTLENLNQAARKINADPSVLVRGQNLRGTPDRHLQGN
jgi:phospholipid/cholesterol/gamma-HCH transport system substrate-binding protein